MIEARHGRGVDGWSPPVSLLPNALLQPDRAGRAIVVGWLTAFLPSLLLGALVTAVLPALGQPQLDLGSGTALVLVAVFAPVVETLIMAGVLAVLLRFVSPTVAVLLSALGWGIAHSLQAPAWGLIVWWPFLVFSTLYVSWRQRSLLAALAVPATVHGLQNFLPAALVYSGVSV
jgi:hypothetical protein